MKLDLSPKLDFFGRQLGVGEHEFCIYNLLQSSEHKAMFRYREMRSESDTLGGIIQKLRDNGWDARRVPYDGETNPEMTRLKIVIHMKDNRISKMP